MDQTPHPYFDKTKPRIFAHRGLVSDYVRENTIAAFASAAYSSIDYLETDIQVSLDGVPLVFHDATLKRLAGDKRKVSQLTLTELKRIDIGVGNRIATLEEALLRFANLCFNLDLKSVGAVSAVADLVNRLNVADRVLISSFSEKRRRAALKLIERPVASSAGSAKVLRIYLLYKLGYFKTQAKIEKYILPLVQDSLCLQLPVKQGPFRFDSPSFISAIHSIGLEVHFWTINDPTEMLRLVKIGADGIVTDRCDLAIATLRNN